ncbi:MAG: hypothetical protein CL512_05945 [Actinobacteria bacterium]|nr:hypothetical protein [Actinomycetota bacterium]|tara:strand:- start:185 stop:385 length:201 start_codon:yes stop_codon:yes gene_type:complete
MSSRNILEYLSKNLNGYESTCWLKTENEKLDGRSPAELMLEKEVKAVEKILNEEVARIKSKRKQAK